MAEAKTTYAYQYLTPLKNCPRCDADLTKPGMIRTECTPGNFGIYAHLHADGSLDDPGGYVRHGQHGATHCAHCSLRLIDHPRIEERQVTEVEEKAEEKKVEEPPKNELRRVFITVELNGTNLPTNGQIESVLNHSTAKEALTEGCAGAGFDGDVSWWLTKKEDIEADVFAGLVEVFCHKVEFCYHVLPQYLSDEEKRRFTDCITASAKDGIQQEKCEGGVAVGFGSGTYTVRGTWRIV